MGGVDSGRVLRCERASARTTVASELPATAWVAGERNNRLRGRGTQ